MSNLHETSSALSLGAQIGKRIHFGTTPQEIENQRKRLLVYSFANLGSLLLLIFAVVSFVHERYLVGKVLLCFVAVILTSGFLAHKMKQVQPVCIFLGVVLLALASYLVLTGAAEGTGAYWSYIPSMLMVLLVGPKLGVLYMALYLMIIIPGLKGSFDAVYPYSEIASTRIIASAIGLYILILLSEWIRVGSYSAITNTSENFRHQANTDALTGLLNRHGIRSAMQARSFEQPAVVALIDLDRFKVINDTYGHDIGDQVLITLADVLQANTKGGDVVARWGGEEFLLILFGTNLHDAEKLIGKIKDRFGGHRFVSPSGNFSASFSAGLALLPRMAEFERSVKQADEHLYQAKEHGRNCVMC